MNTPGSINKTNRELLLELHTIDPLIDECDNCGDELLEGETHDCPIIGTEVRIESRDLDDMIRAVNDIIVTFHHIKNRISELETTLEYWHDLDGHGEWCQKN